MNLSQRQLRMFVTSATLCNISRAAQVLHISQPALTRALQEFEAQLGVQLLRRSTRQVALTHEGAQFLPVAQRLLQDMEQATADLQAQAHGLGGTVSLAVGTAFGCTVLPTLLRRFAAEHPGIRVRLVDDNSAGITSRVARAEVDLGVGSPVGDTGALQCEPLLSAPLGLLGDARVFPLRARMPAAELATLPLLKEGADTSIVQALRSQGSALVAQMERGVEVSSLALQLALACAGAGVAVVSALGASHPQAAGLRFVPLRPTVLRTVFLMQPRQRPPSPSVRALALAIRAGVGLAPLHAAVRRTPAPLSPTRPRPVGTSTTLL
jgi:LysR family carnitine catabolism transcriptional activator